ncbi:uncharacterized protein with ParB-like and HNH nuclease domain [Anaerotaenia torta]|uniref:DUF262 domain-containing protein n=1 Tax=Anaerotaenia torta TaxID=433293 RepID=UPI003D1A8876
MSSTKDISSWNLDYSDIMDIFKNNLKIENSLRSIQSIFLNQRFAGKINYKPYFQRNYVWDKEKATYFIESILLGTEIPPLVLFKGSSNNDAKNEVIDGRQRYETLLKFLGNDLTLQENGLHRLYSFTGQKYIDFDEDTLDSFNNTKLRILQCSVTNEPLLTSEKEDKIKKEIFKRYNSGITPLKREENARAEYIDDPITVALKSYLDKMPKSLKDAEELFLPKSKFGLSKRDRINILIDRIRTILTMTKIPIYNYAKSSRRYDIIRQFYTIEIAQSHPDVIMHRFLVVINLLTSIKEELDKNAIYNNVLFYEVLCWGFLIAMDQEIEIPQKDAFNIAKNIINASSNTIFWSDILNVFHTPEAIFELTGSHYRNATIDRYRFISNYLNKKYQIDFSMHMKDAAFFSSIMDKNSQKEQLISLKLIKPDPVSVTIDDILADMLQSKFLVRPSYQRSEVKNIQKSSYLLESIMLGIKIPPIYIYKGKERVKEVIDGQQRILTLLGFLGKSYIDENGVERISDKHKFRLSGLKILKELNGMNVDDVHDKYPHYIDNILDFTIDVVEIDAAQNPEFNSIDLFLRLNTKPYPIKPDSFEMWNAYVTQAITKKIKSIASQYEGKIFRSKDTRMSNEELITALAYLHYQKTYKSAKYFDLLTIYIRDKHVCARISSKDRITKMLESLTHKDIANFEESINGVSTFIRKLCLVVGDDGYQLPILLGTSHKTDQNFYFLWMFFENLSMEYIQSHKDSVFQNIQKVFKIIAAAPRELNLEVFINKLSKGPVMNDNK